MAEYPLPSLASTPLPELVHQIQSEACSRWLSLFLSEGPEKNRGVYRFGGSRRIYASITDGHLTSFPFFLLSSFFFFLFALKYISPIGALIYMRIPGVNRRFFGYQLPSLSSFLPYSFYRTCHSNLSFDHLSLDH